ncbi:MAG: UDP-glucose 4-epimerase GalE [Planctomycetes bacterium RBG_16_59_8]|nr:MAG: UDP-glucose 4-epimerase GalE [Planctomycetes bacterium RBG_16_59_8]
MRNMILITGGAGYVGSHTVKRFRGAGHSVVVFDSLSRGHREAVPKGVRFEKVDLTDARALESALRRHKRIDGIIHFAAFAYVGESVIHPDLYYTNNVVGSVNLLTAMRNRGIGRIVFSSSCSIYGNAAQQPISEEHPARPMNPYAMTKYVVETMLKNEEKSHGLRFVALRYFNAAGADPEGALGESHDPEPHLIPRIIAAARNKRSTLPIFGNDYPTSDGTCIRDYIHVDDLAGAHLLAWEYLDRGGRSRAINLGTGTGSSVREVIHAVEKAAGRKIRARIAPRREGDPAILVADIRLAKKLLGWTPCHTLSSIIETAWKWHRSPRF